MFQLKPFQIEDLARASLVDGLIFGWDTGLGKTLAGYLWPALKCGFHIEDNCLCVHGRVLLVVPGDLHKQTIDEGMQLLGVAPVILDSQDTFERLVAQHQGQTVGLRKELPPGYYITSYTQLCSNGVQKMPDVEKWKPRALLEWLGLKESPAGGVAREPAAPFQEGHWPDTPAEFFALRGQVWSDEYAALVLTENADQRTLDRHYAEVLRDIAGWRDARAAAQERERIHRAYHILVNLVAPTTCPRYQDLTFRQSDWLIKEFLRRKLDSYALNQKAVGEYHPETGRLCRLDGQPLPEAAAPAESAAVPWRRVKCVYSPSLADRCDDAFDCLVVDEGVRIKGVDTETGLGVRQMRPRFRLVLTATPVKNQLPDIFWLAHWACGSHAEATARWPYNDDPDEQTAFAKTFMVCEQNLTKAAQAKKKSGFKKLRPEICNIHRLWKLLGPVVLRRRKEEADSGLVKKIRRVIGVPMGTRQKGVYQYHLDADYRDKNGMPAPGAKLQALRVASAAPESTLLEAQPGNRRHDEVCRGPAKTLLSHPPPGGWTRADRVPDKYRPPKTHAYKDGICQHCGQAQTAPRSSHAYTPKVDVTLKLILDILQQGEKVAVFSAFNDPLDTLSRHLREAGVIHEVMDGRTCPKKRGLASRRFRQDKHHPDRSFPVMLAGADSMSEGHNWDQVDYVILVAYSWAADKLVQAINRVHRLTSLRDKQVYVVITEGSADRVLESNLHEKNNAADLALDGKLMGERSEEVSPAELLRLAEQDFDPLQQTIDEETLHAQWPHLRDQLRAAMHSWEDPGARTAPTPVAAEITEPAAAPDFRLENLLEEWFPEPAAPAAESPRQLAFF